MMNSFFPIRDRVYFLQKGNTYCEYRYTEGIKSFSGKYIERDVSIQTNTKVIHNLLLSMTLPYEQEVWVNTPKPIQNALLFSYSYHEHQNNKKVANVEIQNWMDIPYFAHLQKIGASRANVRNIIHPRAWFNAVTMVNGNHKKNLRIGHIHFSYDKLDGKEVYCIHWDIGASRFSSSLFTHWLFDDMSS